MHERYDQGMLDAGHGGGDAFISAAERERPPNAVEAYANLGRTRNGPDAQIS
jgi:hypothetical protein